MARMGRPKAVIDKPQFEKLCMLQCTLEEIAGFFNCCEDTVETWCKKEYKKTFSEVFHIKRQAGKVSLRRHQMKMAETNPTMAIWLGKQMLGQRDNKDIFVKQQISQEAIDAVEEFMSYDEDDESGAEGSTTT